VTSSARPETIATRFARHLERRGLLVRKAFTLLGGRLERGFLRACCRLTTATPPA
jgi:hypothetical protein